MICIYKYPAAGMFPAFIVPELQKQARGVDSWARRAFDHPSVVAIYYEEFDIGFMKAHIGRVRGLAG
jgi:hypothetical protein